MLKQKALGQSLEYPVRDVYPMITAGKKGYPRKEILTSVECSYKNGDRLRYKYPNECFNIGRTVCVSGKLVHSTLKNGRGGSGSLPNHRGAVPALAYRAYT